MVLWQPVTHRSPCEVPLASQIKGLAQLQQNAGTSRLLAAKAVSRKQMLLHAFWCVLHWRLFKRSEAWKDKSLRSIPERARRPLALARNGVAPPPLVAPAPPRELREPPGERMHSRKSDVSSASRCQVTRALRRREEAPARR